MAMPSSTRRPRLPRRGRPAQHPAPGGGPVRRSRRRRAGRTPTCDGTGCSTHSRRSPFDDGTESGRYWIASSSRIAKVAMPSPHVLSRGNVALSSTVARSPRRATMAMAAAVPAGPAPTTATSVVSMVGSLTDARLLASHQRGGLHHARERSSANASVEQAISSAGSSTAAGLTLTPMWTSSW